MDRVEMSDKEATVMDQNQHFLDRSWNASL